MPHESHMAMVSLSTKAWSHHLFWLCSALNHWDVTRSTLIDVFNDRFMSGGSHIRVIALYQDIFIIIRPIFDFEG